MSDVGQELCRLWGLNPNEVRRISLIFYPDTEPLAFVTLKVNTRIGEEVKKLRFQP